jgi:hypothetical protein
MNFEWTCQRIGCKKFIGTYTERGLNLLVEDHMSQHQREDTERGVMSTAMAVFVRKDYNVLRLTPVDMGFLKTRGIKIDDETEVDLVSTPKPSKTELGQRLWARILHNSWELIPPKENKNGN